MANSIHVLSVPVFRNPAGDFTNNGVSGRFTELLLACPFGPRSFDPEVEVPLNFCMVSFRMGYAHIVPACVMVGNQVVPRPGWWMYGGNIAYTSDSRFREMVGTFYPLQIHDRRE